MRDLFFLNEEIRQYEKVIIYGAGIAGKTMFRRLLQLNIRVACFADSDPAKCGLRIMNIPVVNIHDLHTLRDSAAVIVCGRYALEVARELETRGFTNLFFDYGNESNFIHLKRDGVN